MFACDNNGAKKMEYDELRNNLNVAMIILIANRVVEKANRVKANEFDTHFHGRGNICKMKCVKEIIKNMGVN